MMVTTYQHDYVPPMTKRYDFVRHPNKEEPKEIVECQCIEESKIQTPKAALKESGAAEWTGIAPMGRLVEPRIIPAKMSPEQADGLAFESNEDCFKTQPNRFLKILRTVYPDLYERLKVMPKEELSRRLERDRMFTTYQIDYCNVNEYPEGVYESLKKEEETSKINASKLLQNKGPCSEFRANVMKELERENAEGYQVSRDECEKAYKPFKISFTDSSRFISSGGNSHWRSGAIFTKHPNFTEYMDSISRNGCVIIRNRLHDHSKCLKNFCRHELKYTCANLK